MRYKYILPLALLVDADCRRFSAVVVWASLTVRNRRLSVVYEHIFHCKQR